MVRRVVIEADDSALWKVAGLRQLERLVLEIHELAVAQDELIQVSIRWTADVPPEKRFVPQHPRLSRVDLRDGQPEPIDLHLTTHLFLPRGSATSAGFAQRIKTRGEWEFLKSRAQVPECEKRFLRGSGKSQDGVVSRFINRPISRTISRRLLHTPITPSGWTFAIFILPLLGSLFLARGDYQNIVAGLFFFQLYSVLDGCDGEIARAKYLESASGRQLDNWCDTMGNLFMVLALGYGLALRTKFYLWEGVVVAALIATNELLLLLPGRATRKSAGALYPRHQQIFEHSGLRLLGESAAGWLIQLTKRDLALVFFLVLALLGQPAWILHLFGTVAAISSLLVLQSIFRAR